MVRKVIDRTGKERVNKFGSKLIIKEYRKRLELLCEMWMQSRENKS